MKKSDWKLPIIGAIACFSAWAIILFLEKLGIINTQPESPGQTFTWFLNHPFAALPTLILVTIFCFLILGALRDYLNNKRWGKMQKQQTELERAAEEEYIITVPNRVVTYQNKARKKNHDEINNAITEIVKVKPDAELNTRQIENALGIRITHIQYKEVNIRTHDIDIGNP